MPEKEEAKKEEVKKEDLTVDIDTSGPGAEIELEDKKPEGEVETLTKTLSSSDNDQIRVSVLKLQNQYREAVGAEPQRLAGNTSQTANTLVPFASLQEAVEARRDKRYDVDPAYRELWERRVGASPFVETS